MPDRILTTHVGSLVRPPALRAFLQARQNGEGIDEASYADCLSSSVTAVVRDQAVNGVDIVSDGEFGKSITWAGYVNERLGGIEHRPNEARFEFPVSGDVRLFPEFWAEYGTSQGIDRSLVTGWVCTGPITYTGHAAIGRDIENLKAGLVGVDVEGAFLPVVAPSSVHGIRWDTVYASEEEYLHAAGEAMREEYSAILDAGLLLQIDDAYLPWMYDLKVPTWTMDEYRAWVAMCVDALNHAIRGLPKERIRYHICWGSFNAPHVGDVAFREIADEILRIEAGAFLIEMANPRHEHEWHVWEDVGLPEGAVLVPGVISHATNVVEHPELVAERLVRLAKLVGRENVMGGTDCGFAQGPLVQRVHPTIQWAKLRSLAEGAELATRELWA